MLLPLSFVIVSVLLIWLVLLAYACIDNIEGGWYYYGLSTFIVGPVSLGILAFLIWKLGHKKHVPEGGLP